MGAQNTFGSFKQPPTRIHEVSHRVLGRLVNQQDAQRDRPQVVDNSTTFTHHGVAPSPRDLRGNNALPIRRQDSPSEARFRVSRAAPLEVGSPSTADPNDATVLRAACSLRRKEFPW